MGLIYRKIDEYFAIPIIFVDSYKLWKQVFEVFPTYSILAIINLIKKITPNTNLFQMLSTR